MTLAATSGTLASGLTMDARDVAAATLPDLRVERVVQVHNRYRVYGGEDAAVKGVMNLLIERGMVVSSLIRDSGTLRAGPTDRWRAAIEGFWSRQSYRAMSELIERERPQVAHVHNVYPLLTPSVLSACRRLAVPIVMTCHNYRLVCPIGVHVKDGVTCERCVGGREYWCVLRNCRDNVAESAVYAARTAAARLFGQFRKNVTMFVAVTEFVKRRLIEAGYPADRIVVLPNAVAVPAAAADPSAGTYVGYLGRISPEKGIATLLRAASEMPDIDIRLAGDWSSMPEIVGTAPGSVALLGALRPERTGEFFRGARCVVIPSICFEGCPMVLLEAMSHGVPVVASRTGGMSEIIDDGLTGLLVDPGDAEDLANKIRFLWENPQICRQMGAAARERAIRCYSEDVYFERLLSVYERAMDMHARRKVVGHPQLLPSTGQLPAG